MIILIYLMCILFVCITNASIYREWNDEYVSLYTSKIEKGIAACLIMANHLQMFSGPAFLKPVGYIGFICVAVFLFYSGYGLTYGLHNKQNYLKGFFRKILKLLVPYWIVNTLSIILKLAIGIVYPIHKYILSYLSIDYITGTWFVTAIIIFYIAFYVIYTLIDLLKLDRKKYGILFMAIFTVIYIIVAVKIGLGANWYASIAAFVFGIIFANYKDIITATLKCNYCFYTVVFILLFLCTWGGRLYLAAKGIDNVIMHIIMRNIVSLLFVMSMICITLRVKIGNRIAEFLGEISYELYLVHFILLTPAARIIGSDSYLYSLVIIVMSIVLAGMIHRGVQGVNKS